MLTQPTRRTGYTNIYDKAIGFLIWLGFAAAGLGVLYACSKLVGD